MTDETNYLDLIDACKQPRGPVCRLERVTVDGYLDSIFLEHLKEFELGKDSHKSLSRYHNYFLQL
jgi:hypothetical protein